MQLAVQPEIALRRESLVKQILLKEASQGLNRGLIDGFEEAAQRAAIRQFIPSKQSHKRGSEGQKALVEGFEGGFPTQTIADQDDHKIDGVIDPEASASKADTLGYLLKQIQMGQIVSHDGHFPQPRRR